MIKRTIQAYFDNFKGFSSEIWILTLITFINRAGTMVLPFLSKYLKENLHFTYQEVGTIMVCFGLGSMVGSWLGGKLSDKIGFYKVLIFSLLTSGFLFIGLQFITTFWGLCLGMFCIMSVADMFRPAMFVSINEYAGPERRTRALTLVRLAINLGFSVGPAIGGLIIMYMGYSGLFWVDGITCIIAISLFALLVKEKKSISNTEKAKDQTFVVKPYKDQGFVTFLFVSFVTGMIFFQLFSTLPLYHKEQFDLTEFKTGLLMTLNGLIIFVFEMPVVSYLEKNKIEKLRIVFFGALLMGISFYILLFRDFAFSLVLSMIFVSVGEMLAFPFSNSFVMNRAPKGQEGSYMALYTMSFSLAHIIGSKMGMEVVNLLGYQFNWVFMGSLGILAACTSLYILKKF